MDSKILIVETTKVRFLTGDIFELKVGYKPNLDPNKFKVDFGNDIKASVIEEPNLHDGYFACKYYVPNEAANGSVEIFFQKTSRN